MVLFVNLFFLSYLIPSLSFKRLCDSKIYNSDGYTKDWNSTLSRHKNSIYDSGTVPSLDGNRYSFP